MTPAREKTESQLAATFTAAMQIWDGQKAQGVPERERLKGLEQTLRASWPFTREWKHLCHECEDTGLRGAGEIKCPGDATCGRSAPHLPHTFGAPCWCSLGKRFQARAPEPEDVLAQAAKTRKPARIGR